MKKWLGSFVAMALILAPVNAIAAVKQLLMERNSLVLKVARNLFGTKALRLQNQNH
jgi:hypothetical protein